MYIKFKSAYKKADKVGYVILSVVLNYSSTQHTIINVTPYFLLIYIMTLYKSATYVVVGFFIFCSTRTQEV